MRTAGNEIVLQLAGCLAERPAAALSAVRRPIAQRLPNGRRLRQDPGPSGRGSAPVRLGRKSSVGSRVRRGAGPVVDSRSDAHLGPERSRLGRYPAPVSRKRRRGPQEPQPRHGLGQRPGFGPGRALLRQLHGIEPREAAGATHGAGEQIQGIPLRLRGGLNRRARRQDHRREPRDVGDRTSLLGHRLARRGQVDHRRPSAPPAFAPGRAALGEGPRVFTSLPAR